jgi:tetratricopeptide (TPR) repeat protein
MMKRVLVILAGVAVVCAVGYLSWLNPDPAEFHFSPTGNVRAPLAALLVAAFVVGVMLVLAAVAVQAGRRAVGAWRVGRQQRRSERIDQWTARGTQLIWDGEAQQGRALLYRAWRRAPQSPHAVVALATSFQDTGELARARAVLDEAARDHHTNPEVLLQLADLHRDSGDAQASIEVLERLRALQPRAPRVLRALRERYVGARRWDDACTVQEGLLAELRDPDGLARERAYLTALRHQAAVGLADPKARVQALEALAERRSVVVPISVSLGDALAADGRADEASAVWERALRNLPRTILVDRLAGIASGADHRERLRGVLRRLRPDQAHADNLRLLSAELYLRDGNVDQAAQQLDGIRNPGDAPALLRALQAQVYRGRGQLDQAIAAYSDGGSQARPYRCLTCERTSREWVAWCPTCSSWDSYRSEVEIGLR